MYKDMTIIRKGLVVEVGRFEKSHIKGWIGIYSRAGERIGGFCLLDNQLEVIHKNKTDDDYIHLVYSIIDREGKK